MNFYIISDKEKRASLKQAVTASVSPVQTDAHFRQPSSLLLKSTVSKIMTAL